MKVFFITLLVLLLIFLGYKMLNKKKIEVIKDETQPEAKPEVKPATQTIPVFKVVEIPPITRQKSA